MDNDNPYVINTRWPSWVPFGQDWDALAQLGVYAALILLVSTALVLSLVFTSKRRSRNASRRYAQSVENVRVTLHPPLIEDVEISDGEYRGHLDVVRDLTDEWDAITTDLPHMIDNDNVSGARKRVRSRWNDTRIRELCLRYRVPLGVVLEPARWERVCDQSGLAFKDGARVLYPELVLINEDESGLVLRFEAEPALTAKRWIEALPVLSNAMDAPKIAVYRADAANTVELALNDADIRVAHRVFNRFDGLDPEDEVADEAVDGDDAVPADPDAVIADSDEDGSDESNDAPDEINLDVEVGGNVVTFNDHRTADIARSLLSGDSAHDALGKNADRGGEADPVPITALSVGDLILGDKYRGLFIGDGEVLVDGGEIVPITDVTFGDDGGAFRLKP